jgi:hypothetical protein
MQVGKLVSHGAVALAVTVSGCADAGPGGAALSLSATEVNQLFTEINSIFGQAGVSVRSADVRLFFSRVPSVNFNRSVAITNSINCTGGGTAGFSGTEATDGSSVDVTVTFSGCTTTHYTVDGNYHFAVSTTATAITVTGTGDLEIKTADNRSGSCNIDYKVTTTLNGQASTGKICGVDASAIAAVS